MIETLAVEPLSKAVMEEIGLSWHTDQDGSDYVPAELVQLSEEEAEAYYDAANDLYDMYVEASEHVIEQQRYEELGIPFPLQEMIEQSWNNEDLHLYGRFDLAGGMDGLPIKLIEFNADTPTSLFETSIVQWALLKANGMDETAQFNNLHEMLQENFQRLITRQEEPEAFGRLYREEKLLFSSLRNFPEDERTVRYLQQVAHEAGFFTDFCYLDQAGFLERQGVFNQDQQRTDFWFKLYPWENLASEEPELTQILAEIAQHRVCGFLNPAYTLLFQSKGMLKILWEQFPDSPYLLPTAFEPLPGVAQVEKRLFGREGANMRILDANGRVLQSSDGPYGNHPSIYQELAQFPKDAAGNHYQAGVFYVWEACGLGFRRGGAILDNGSKFVAHRVV